MVMESVYIGGSWVDKAVHTADRLAALDRQVTALQRCNTDYVEKNRALQARVDYLEGILAEAGAARRRDMFDPARLEANRVVTVEQMKLAARQEFLARTVPA